jgi:hypothetical protein
MIFSAPEPAMATGPFLNLPTYYAHVDTSRATIDIGQSFVEGEFENSTALSFETGFRSGERTRVRMQILYPIIRADGYYNHGFGDLMISAELRIIGDTLRINGLFFRGDMRIPTGPASRWPYAGESLDGGGGVEYRRLSETFDLRCSATYSLVGRKAEEEFFRNENYTLAGVLLGLKPFDSLSIDFSAFAQFFRNGDFREVYLLSGGTRLKGGLDVRVSAGIDNGGSLERVWNSMIQIGITWRFPGTRKREHEPDDNLPGGMPQGGFPPEKTTP